MDGRVQGFTLPVGKFSRPTFFFATLISAPATGADRIRLNLSPAFGTLKRGTLLNLGNVGTDNFQLVEVVKDVTASMDTTVRIAPRIRRKFAGGSVVIVGANATGQFKLTSDQLSESLSISSGVLSFSASELP
jgi:hypothetical protein